MEQLSKERLMISLDETASTNAALKLLQQKEPLLEGSWLKANFQTNGRGQMGNTWFSGKGYNLLFSFLLYPRFVIVKEQFVISRIVSLALKKVLDQYLDNITIKWPNDIYWKDKKIAGMLIENSLMGQQIEYTIVGVGLNVNQDNFPSDLPNPVSMSQITKSDYNKDELLTFFFREFFLLYRSLQNNGKQNIEQEYVQYLYRSDSYHWYEDKSGRFKGKIINVLPSGHLVVTTHQYNEERTYAFKEVAFIL